MICPHCKKDVSESTVAKHFAAKGGKASKRKITADQQAMMQSAKKAKKAKQKQNRSKTEAKQTH